MEIIETTREKPLCPHCNKEVSQLMASRVKAKFGVRFIYFCSHCRKVLGVSHRKGFWMG